MRNKIILFLLGIFILAQFVQPSRQTEEYDPSKDFLTMVDGPEDYAAHIRNACYDCHSYETEYPWYAYITPVNWWLNNHVQEGRSEMNFSIWGTYPKGKRDHKLEECGEALREGWMPLSSYTNVHAEADLDQPTRERLTKWMWSLR